MKEFHEESQIIGSFMVAIFVLGYGIGPLFLGPLTEIYGRYPVTILSTWFFLIFLMGCGLAPNMPALIAMRLLAGLGGSAAMIVPPAVVADLYPVEQRGFWNSIIILAQCGAPALGPVIGGFVTQGLGWRWVSQVNLNMDGRHKRSRVLANLHRPTGFCSLLLESRRS
jgi:MFS family permease